MKLLTKDNRLLDMVSIGELITTRDDAYSSETGSTKIVCRTESRRKVVVDVADVQQFFGTYLFPTVPKHVKQDA